MSNIAWSPAASTATRSVQGVGTTSYTFGAAATDGMLLDSVATFAVYVEADSGQTITTAIQLKGFAQDPYTSRWNDAPDWNFDNPNGSTGVRGQYMGSLDVTGPVGRVGFQVSAGAVSSGNLTIRIVATDRTGRLL